MSSIEISLIVVDDDGSDTTFCATFEDTLARWPELHDIFHKATAAVQETQVREPKHAAVPETQAQETKYVPAAYSRRDLQKNWEAFQQEAGIKAVPPARDYGVRNMTAEEVQQLLERKDAEAGKLRDAIVGLQDEVGKRSRFAESQEAAISQLRETLDFANRTAGDMGRQRSEAMQALDAEQRNSARLEEKITELLDKHVEQLDAAEKRYQALMKDARDQAEAMGKVLVEAVEQAKADVDADTGGFSSEVIHKNDVNAYIDGILKRVAPEAAPQE